MNSYSIDVLDNTFCSINLGEVFLTVVHKCGCKIQYLMSSEQYANSVADQYQNMECRRCADNTAYAKRTGGYLTK